MVAPKPMVQTGSAPSTSPFAPQPVYVDGVGGGGPVTADQVTLVGSGPGGSDITLAQFVTGMGSWMAETEGRLESIEEQISA